MTKQQEKKCKLIIHSHAILAGAGNLMPIPGTGAAADIVTMTTMAVALSKVFGDAISKNTAKCMVIAAIKRTVLRQPIKTAAKEISKLVPFLGLVVSPAISAAMVESVGWTLASELSEKMNPRLADQLAKKLNQKLVNAKWLPDRQIYDDGDEICQNE
ncbi:MAG: hypothetical protein Q4F00_07575 [bacterium]|nr:hypothetical protein [bacterium]